MSGPALVGGGMGRRADRSEVGAGAGWMPETRLMLGITGHRLSRMDPAHRDALGATVDAALGLVEEAALAADPPARPSLVSGLADGADAAAADAALARGWALDAVLPFARREYARDFADGGAVLARQLATARDVLELPSGREAREAAYERAGRAVLAQCDLLLAVWDGKPSRGRGGTAQVVAEAVLDGVPVLWIDPAGERAPALLWGRGDNHDFGPTTVDTAARAGIERLPELVRLLTAPPPDGRERAMLARFGAPLRRGSSLAAAYPLLLAAAGVRRLSARDFRLGDPAAAAAPVLASCPEVLRARAAAVVAPRFARADLAANQVARLFRSSFVANAGLAALAVMLALGGLALPGALKPLLVALEFVILAAILLTTGAGNRVAWHRRWLDQRELAERLRCLVPGAALAGPGLRREGATGAPWVRWYVRATQRELGLPSVAVDAAYLGEVRSGLGTLLDDQVGYLRADARRMHLLEHRLHLAGTWLFAVTAVVCAAVFAAEALVQVRLLPEGLLAPLGYGPAIVSGTLPAVGGAIYSIRMQGEFAGAAERSHTLAEELAQLRAGLDRDGLSYDALARRTARAVELLTDDLASWRQTYQARPLTLPG